MKVTVLDDYQRAFEYTDAIKRLSQRVEVEILTEKLATEDAAVSALKGSQAIIPIRERTKFTASLLKALTDLEYISQTGSHVYHVDMEAATRLGIVVSLAPGGNSASELAIGLMLAVMRQIPRSDRAVRRGEWPLGLRLCAERKNPRNLGAGKNRH
jgi:phosphoglycerate dehydrogenase-like enzyme